MRSLPEWFEPKVTALEENDTYKNMKPSEVIGRLLAYESRKATTSPPKKKKNLALKNTKVEKEEEDSNEDMALIAKGFKKFLKLQKNGYGSKGDDFKKKKPTIKNVKPLHKMSSREKTKCYECEDSGISPRIVQTWKMEEMERNGPLLQVIMMKSLWQNFGVRLLSQA